MNNTVYIKKYDSPEVSFKEIRRYMKTEQSSEIDCLISQCLDEVSSVIDGRICFSVFDVNVSTNNVKSDYFDFSSDNLAFCLRGCTKVILFGATLGVSFDRLIAKYSHSNQLKSVCLHAIGAERIEAYCDMFCDELKSQYKIDNKVLTPRFSPGYGDLDISVQSDFFNLLSLNKNLGISLTENYMMIPSKSVTAIIGIK